MSKLRLTPPVIITPRLMAGVRVGDAFISIEYSQKPGQDGRIRYHFCIDTDKLNYDSDDLQSGAIRVLSEKHSMQEGLENLLGFLTYAGDHYRYLMWGGWDENDSPLFPETIMEWAYMNDSELASLSEELETSILITEQ